MSAPPEDERPGLIERRTVHEGRIVHLSMDTVRFPDGTTGELEMIRHRGAAAVLPVDGSLSDPDPDVLLVHQYRYASGGYLYEVPAGLRDEGDTSWEACARRELEEETGFVASRMVRMTTVLTTPGFTDEEIHLFVATGLNRGSRSLQPDEFLDLIRLPFSEALSWIEKGKIRDGKSVAALLYAETFRR